jgi:serine/threonine protein kinase
LKQVYHTSNNCYIITEYCERGDVAGYLKSQLRLTEREALGLLRDLLSAYQYLVSKNILHRDIKPANTFLTADGTLKLADFGFALHHEDGELGKLNVGSPVYMAPECLEKSEYSFKSDIFAIGVFYYELLHGYTPWPCRSEEELLRRINT